MTGYHRFRAEACGHTPHHPGAFFDVLCDFGGVMKWFPKENPPMFLRKVQLLPGHDDSMVPRIRLAFQDKSVLPHHAPEIVAETLLCADRETRTFSYDLVGEPYGMRNYVCLIEVDESGDGGSIVRCLSRWDGADKQAGEATAAMLVDFYQRGMIQGISGYLDSLKPVEA